MSLPLNVKRAVRDTEPLYKKFEENASEAAGFPITVGFDNAAIYSALSEANHHTATTFPTILAESYLPPILEAIKLVAKKGSLAKAALADAWTSKKLTLAFIQKQELYDADKATLSGDYYNGFRFRDGNLEFVSSLDSWYCNVDDISRFDLSTLFTSNDMPLGVSVAWENAKPQVAEKVSAIRKAVGDEKLELEVDLKVLYKTLKKQFGDDKYHTVNDVSRIGDYLTESIINYLDGLAACLENCSKDDMVKEAIQESLTNKKIKFHILTSDAEFEKFSSAIKSGSSNYVSAGFDGGNVNIYTRIDRYYSNIDEIRYLDLSTLF